MVGVVRRWRMTEQIETETKAVQGMPVPRHVHLSTINKVLGWIGLTLVVAIRPDYSRGTAFWIERKKKAG